jgi:ubiquinone/menaquinone biosynthesis C-methylase UbiE
MRSLREKYDEIVEELTKRTYKYRYELYDKILDFLPIQQKGLFVDIGSGTGNFSLYLRKRSNCKIICIDNSSEMVKRLQQKVKTANVEDIEVCRGDLLSLPFPDNRIDISFSKFVLHDVKNKNKAITEMIRVLRKGGNICIVDLLRGDLNNLYNTLTKGLGITTELFTRNDKRLSLHGLSKLIRTNGADIQVELELHFSIVFEDIHMIDTYLQLFGVYEGYDVPIGEIIQQPRQKIMMTLKDYFGLNTSLNDERRFGIVIGVKK